LTVGFLHARIEVHPNDEGDKMQANELEVGHIGYPVFLKFTQESGSVRSLAGTLVSFVDHDANESKETVAGRVLVVDAGRLGPTNDERFMVVYDRDIESVEVA
jgi:hypothetical protein